MLCSGCPATGIVPAELMLTEPCRVDLELCTTRRIVRMRFERHHALCSRCSPNLPVLSSPHLGISHAHLLCLRISAGRGRRVPNGHVTGGRRRTRNLINEAASGIASGTSRPGPGLASRNVTFRVATGVDSARPGATKAPSRRLVASRSRALLVLEQSTGTSRDGAVRARSIAPPGPRQGKISLRRRPLEGKCKRSYWAPAVASDSVAGRFTRPARHKNDVRQRDERPRRTRPWAASWAAAAMRAACARAFTAR